MEAKGKGQAGPDGRGHTDARSLPALMWALESGVVQGCGTHLGHKVLEAGDDVGALKFLVVAEAAGDHDHSNEGQCQVQLGRRGGGRL